MGLTVSFTERYIENMRHWIYKKTDPGHMGLKVSFNYQKYKRHWIYKKTDPGLIGL